MAGVRKADIQKKMKSANSILFRIKINLRITTTEYVFNSKYSHIHDMKQVKHLEQLLLTGTR